MAIDAQRLRCLREQRGWSQEQLANVSGLSARTIQRVEATGAASLETRMALAAALELAPAELLAVAQALPPEVPPPADVNVGRQWSREYVLLTVVVLILLLAFVQMMFGYRLGRDLAIRDDGREQQEPAGSGR